MLLLTGKEYKYLLKNKFPIAGQVINYYLKSIINITYLIKEK